MSCAKLGVAFLLGCTGIGVLLPFGLTCRLRIRTAWCTVFCFMTSPSRATGGLLVCPHASAIHAPFGLLAHCFFPLWSAAACLPEALLLEHNNVI